MAAITDHAELAVAETPLPYLCRVQDAVLLLVAGPWAVVADLLAMCLRCVVESEAVAERWAFLGSSLVFSVIWSYSIYRWVTLLSAALAADDQPSLISARSTTIVVQDEMTTLLYALFQCLSLLVVILSTLCGRILRIIGLSLALYPTAFLCCAFLVHSVAMMLK